jgi:hypothetical protein
LHLNNSHKQSTREKHGEKRRQGNTTPQKANNKTIEDLVESEEGESSVTDVRRMMIRMFYELKEDIQNNSMNSKRT